MTPAGEAPTQASPTRTSAPSLAAGSAEDLVRALAPPGATETSRSDAAGALYVTFEIAAPLEDLTLYWDERLAGLGIEVVSRTTAGGGVTYVFTNPDGGIVAVPDPDGEGDLAVAVSVVTGD